ncbi:MAG: prolipoprotein diacylglyceryl transferase family protein [Candidatus Paceibacterota bacterium]
MLPYFSITQLSFGPIVIQVWGFWVALGFILALIISLREARRRRIEEEIIWDFMIIALLGMILGGRIFYLFFGSDENISALADLHSGFSLMGGAMVSGIFVFAYLKYKKQNITQVFDLLTLGAITALIFTRIGCSLVGDHIGKITTLPWGREFVDGTVRHPVALYEIFFLIIIFFIILDIKTKQKKEGALFVAFCFLYAFCRFFADFLRCEDMDFCDPHFWGFTATQWVLLFLIILLSFLYFSKLLKQNR